MSSSSLYATLICMIDKHKQWPRYLARPPLAAGHRRLRSTVGQCSPGPWSRGWPAGQPSRRRALGQCSQGLGTNAPRALVPMLPGPRDQAAGEHWPTGLRSSSVPGCEGWPSEVARPLLVLVKHTEEEKKKRRRRQSMAHQSRAGRTSSRVGEARRERLRSIT